jgi:hypothetical protein
MSLCEEILHPGWSHPLSPSANTSTSPLQTPLTSPSHSVFSPPFPISTNDEVLARYFTHSHSLFIDDATRLVIKQVTSGTFVHFINLNSGVFEFNLANGVTQISGHTRIKESCGAQFSINGGILILFRPPTHRLRVFHTNDVHCVLLEIHSVGGLSVPKFVTFVKRQREIAREENAALLFVDAGDSIEGGPVFRFTNGSAGFERLTEVDSGVIIAGNNEWDYGYDAAFEKLKKVRENKIDSVCAKVEDCSHEIELPPSHWTGDLL